MEATPTTEDETMTTTEEAIIRYYQTVREDTDPGLRAKALGTYMETVHDEKGARQKMSTALQAHNLMEVSAFVKRAQIQMFKDGDHTIHSDHTRLPTVRLKGRGAVAGVFH